MFDECLHNKMIGSNNLNPLPYLGMFINSLE